MPVRKQLQPLQSRCVVASPHRAQWCITPDLLQERDRARSELKELHDTVFSKAFKAPSAWAEREVKYKMDKKQWDTEAEMYRAQLAALAAENDAFRAAAKSDEYESRIAVCRWWGRDGLVCFSVCVVYGLSGTGAASRGAAAAGRQGSCAPRGARAQAGSGPCVGRVCVKQTTDSRQTEVRRYAALATLCLC